MSEENKIGVKIRQIREDRGMSKEELAESSQSSVELIEELESGALIPSLTPLFKDCQGYGCSSWHFSDDSRI